ncbi:DUF998 domain-containing protein [Alkalicoccobacillus porphyridii]|uniref:DUF998 domain-containing protein n=1 Tax=Alkalicoccobacillus porphyridii TaxID=2597270 RepID=A0A553ZWA4_9BACI|nr:DUF998 domain-containing protein [Alkalicoccobacillus porphyridii]TSB45713.1 hypothetical protein FN960_14595 [Alkalicoccobacillus porphyridii]
MKIPASIGIGGWLFAIAYFLYEPFAIHATTVPYHWLLQPMSDLGVTECGRNTYALAPYDICSPHAYIVNVLFLLTSVALLIGSLYIYQQLKKDRVVQLANVGLIIFAGGIGFSVIPANVDFLWHTVPAILSMMIIGPSIGLYSMRLNKGKWLSYLSCALVIGLFISFFVMIFIPFELGGLLQRLFYLVAYVWGLAISLILSKGAVNEHAKIVSAR